jgi:Fusaric acid resistance protein family
LRRIYAEAAWLQQLASEELKPRPGRIRTSIRMALIGAVGTALMAALHIASALGPYTLWVALYSSKALMTASTGLAMVLTAAVFLSASVPLAGILVQAPWALLPFFGLATALITYGRSKHGLDGAWLPLEITFLDTFYLCVFDPQGFGGSVASTFSGVALAIGVLVAFDMVLWPDPAERALLRSLADTLDRQHERLAAIGRAYLDPLAATVLPQPAVVSALFTQHPLLERAGRELNNPQREAILLAAVTTTERLHIEIEQLLTLARENVPRDIRAQMRPEIEAVLEAIAAALRHHAHQAATGLALPDDPTYTELSTAISLSLDALQARETLALTQLPSADAAAIANIAAFNLGLRKIGLRLLNRPLGEVYGLALPKEKRAGATPSGAAGPALKHYSAKVALAVTLAYVVGVASHRSQLSVTVWTARTAGLPNYGATLRKMILRVVGAVIGGLLALSIMMVISPNFESLEWYLAAFFVVLFFCAYVSLSSGRLAYAGQQAGTAFIVAYASLSPSVNFYEPLWRMWGIFLGLTIVTLVFLLVATEYAGKSIVPRLTRILHAALDLLPPASGLTEERVRKIDMDVTLNLTQLLAIAEDARLEGRQSGIDPDRVIEAAGTLRRIMLRLSGIATGRLTVPQPVLPAEIQAARAACETALRYHLQSWLEILEDEHGPDRHRILEVAARFTPDDLMVPLAKLQEHLSTFGLRELASWPAAARSTLLAEIESYRRLVVLVTELDQQFVKIPAATR